MAEMEVKSGGGHKGPGVKKGKKLSTRVDLRLWWILDFYLSLFLFLLLLWQNPLL
jgi:hypothetical protein